MNTQLKPTTSQPQQGKNSTGHGSSGGHSGKKRKNRKKKGKSFSKPSLPPVKAYISKCCGTSTKKPRVGSALKAKRNDDNEQTDFTQVNGLGHWRCDNCKKPCKVTVQAHETQSYNQAVI